MYENPLKIEVFGKEWDCLDGDGALPLRHRGVVFWHPAGGFDTEMFTRTFGAVFREQIAALNLKAQDFETEYHTDVQRSLCTLVKKQRRAHYVSTR